MSWKRHRINDGRLVRRGSFLSLIGLVLFGCYSWFHWQKGWKAHLWEATDWKINLNLMVVEFGDKGVILHLDALGAMILFLAGFAGAFYTVYVSPKSANFLIETEAELRKVTWPDYKPWFRMDTEIWGSSYVVIFLLCMLAVVIAIWDWLLQELSNITFYS